MSDVNVFCLFCNFFQKYRRKTCVGCKMCVCVFVTFSGSMDIKCVLDVNSVCVCVCFVTFSGSTDMKCVWDVKLVSGVNLVCVFCNFCNCVFL